MPSVKRCSAVLLLALAGCISTGPRIDADQLTGLQKGKTTIANVTARFGKPTSSVKSPDGSQTLVYYHSEARPDATTFIPIIGGMVGDVSHSMHSVIFEFDANGVLTDYKIADATTRSGLLKGLDATPAQPQ